MIVEVTERVLLLGAGVTNKIPSLFQNLQIPIDLQWHAQLQSRR